MALQFPKGPHIQQQASPMRTATNILASIPQTLEAAKLKNINKELSGYFINNSMGEGGFNTASGDLTYESNYMLPSYQDAWTQYKGIHEKYGKSVGMENYGAFKQMYSEMAQMHASKLQSEIMKFSNAGYSQDEIRYALKDSPAFASNYSNLVSDPIGGANYSSMFAPYAPHKSFLEGISGGNLGNAAIVGTGAAVGLTALGRGSSKKAIETAKGLYKTELKSARDILNKANEKIDKDLKNESWKNTKEYKAAKGAGKAKITRKAKADAKSLKEQALKQFKSTRGGMEFKPTSRAKDLLKGYKKLGGAGPALAYGLGTNLASAAGEKLFDSKKAGEALGAGTGAALTIGAGVGPTIQNAIKKYGMKKIISRVASVGGVKLAASMLAKGALTGSGIGTAVGAGLLAKDLYQIYDIIQDMD